jgi:hypothetical protein
VRRTAVLLAALLASLVAAQPAAADAAAESQFVSLTNSSRASAGIGRLSVDGELTSIARRWSAKMAADNRLAHNPNLSREVTQDWTKLGENVGVGDNPDQIHQAFMNSPAHRANILDGAFTRVGVGVVRGGDGRIWVTEVFMRLRSDDGGAGGSSAPPPPPPTTAAPPPRPPAAARPRPPAPATTVPPPPTTVATTTTTSTTTTTLPAVRPAPPLPPQPSARVVLVLAQLVAVDRGR